MSARDSRAEQREAAMGPARDTGGEAGQPAVPSHAAIPGAPSDAAIPGGSPDAAMPGGSSLTPGSADGPGQGAGLLSLRHAAKAFGAVQAIADGSIELYAGEAHGLVGENGAGKSTMVK